MKSLEERLTEFHANRQPPTVALKYRLMASNEFTFFRATCHLFYEHLSSLSSLVDSPLAWCCGDLHLENFGSYRAENGLVYFDINDFDEGILAPVTWELYRFLCSIGMASDLWKYSAKEAEGLMSLALTAYTKQIMHGKAYSIERETSPELIQEFFKMAEKQREKELIKDRVNIKKEKLKIIDGKTLPLNEESYKTVKQSVGDFLKEQYGFFKVKDIAFRIAGTGSLGVKRYVVLVLDERQDKLRLLDVKQAFPSCLAPYVTNPQPTWASDADRVLGVQSLMGYALPRFISVFPMDGQKYLLKQMQPSSQKIGYNQCHKKFKNVETIMITMAQAVASAQLRSAARKGSAPVDTLIDFASQTHWQDKVIHTSVEMTGVMKNYFEEFKELGKG